MRRAALSRVVLKSGSHKHRSDGMCVMEAVAWFAGEGHSDHPAGACPVIASFLRSWNDSLSTDEARTRLLVPLIPSIAGSRSTPAVEARRAWLAVDWMVRDRTPAELDTAGMFGSAFALRGRAPIVDVVTANAANNDLMAAIKDSDWTTVGSRVWETARVSAQAAAGETVRAAGGAVGKNAPDSAEEFEHAAASTVRLVERMIAEKQLTRRR